MQNKRLFEDYRDLYALKGYGLDFNVDPLLFRIVNVNLS
jgi:hypothetical protein